MLFRSWKKSVVDPFTLGLYIAVFILNALSGFLPFRVPAAVLVIMSGIAGILVASHKNLAKGKDGEEQ